MAIRFENGIVGTLGKTNRVLWNSTVVTEGDRIAAIGPVSQMARRFPQAEAVDCSGRSSHGHSI
jgi:predicted amidohydrolase YtcJ